MHTSPLGLPLTSSIRGSAPGIESTGRLPSDLVADLRASGVFGMWIPRELGGAESPPADVIDTVEGLAAADGSTGWCVAVSLGSNALAAYLPEVGAREIFPTPSTISAGVFNPTGKATVGDDALVLSGRWSFGSGSRHCDWLCGGCVVVDGAGQPVVGEDGRPEVRIVFFPAGDATIIDTWKVVGLQGTGSHDFAVTALPVPPHHVMTTAFEPWPAGAMWRMPPMALLFAPMAAVSLGIARAAIDELVGLAGEKTPYRSARTLAERDVVQSMVARAEAAVRSARAFLREALEELSECAHQGDPITLRQRALARLAVVNSSQAAIHAVDLCFEAAGSTALFTTNPLQRYFRDVHAAGQHVVLAFSGFETVGRVLLGLDPDTSLL